MIQLLARWLIPDRENVTSPAVRRAYGTLCGVVGIALNLLLFAGKLFAGQLSGSRPASRKPSSVTAEDPASDRLLKASAVTAMEPESCPAKNFPANSRMFRAMPTTLHSVP